MSKQKNLLLDKKLKEILALDSTLRFVGILGYDGHLLHHARRKNIKPLLNTIEAKTIYLYRAAHNLMHNAFDHILGKTVYQVAYREKVIFITIPLTDNLLILSTDISCNYVPIIKKIISIINR